MAPLPQHILVLALTTDFTYMRSEHIESCPDIGPWCQTQKPPPQPSEHHLQNYAYGLTLDAQYGLLPWLTVATTVPYRFVTTFVRYTDLEGNPYTPVPPDTHHRNETVTGFGDPTVALVAGQAVERLGYSLRLGAMLPFGRTLDADPFELGRLGIPHEHIQFGAGTVRPVLGSALGYDFGAVGVDAFFLGTMSIAANSIGYKPGQRIDGGFRVSSTLGLSRARFGIGGELVHESTETWQGLQQEEGNLGRTDVLAVLTGRWLASPHVGLFGALKVPLYVDAVGAQLWYPFYVELGVASGFSL